MKKIFWMIAVIVVVGAGVYFWQHMSTLQPGGENKVTPAQYTNSTYHYSFTYNSAMSRIDDADPARVKVASKNDSSWSFGVAAIENKENLSVATLANRQAFVIANSGSASSSVGTTIDDMTIAGEPAKYLSATNWGEYGNAFVIVKNDTATFVIVGDDATPANKKAFAEFLASFTFTP